MAGRLRELEARLQQISGEQANLLANIGAAVTHAVSHGEGGPGATTSLQGTTPTAKPPKRSKQAGATPALRSGRLGPPEAQVAALTTLAEARGYGAHRGAPPPRAAAPRSTKSRSPRARRSDLRLRSRPSRGRPS
jgi:hypothetical protein